MICIYAIQQTNRLRFALDIVFRYVLQIDYKLSTDFSEFLSFDGPKLLYGKKEFTSGLKVDSHELLFEQDISKKNIQVSKEEDVPVFFQSTMGILPFDVFAATFYMVSRYEEYLPFESDVHDRFPAKVSLAFKNDFLDQPIVHVWCDWLLKEIQKKYPELRSGERTFESIYTYDIDEAYVYRHRKMGYNLKGLAGDVFRGRFTKVKKRLQVLTGIKKDPFDTYNKIIDRHRLNSGRTIFFFKVNNTSYYDRGLSGAQSELQELIKKMNDIGEIGIHPSYYSSRRKSIASEKTHLEEIVAEPVATSRQHYLRIRFPRTYDLLIKAGITSDFTLTFADAIGFRSGMCIAYPYFSLKSNSAQDLMIYPTTVMDGTLKDYLKLSPAQAIEKLRVLKGAVEKYNGLFIPLWHNSSFWDETGWHGWEDVYDSLF